MVFEGVKGLEFFNNIDMLSFASGIGRVFLSIVILVGVGVGTYFLLWYKKKGKKYDKKIFWFEEVNGVPTYIDSDVACELTIPNTSIKVFYIKDKDMYLPRPVKKMGKNDFWFMIRNNREVVNFSIKNLNKEMKEANLDFDHTDMRYALDNLLDLIKRNYRDKATKWWMEYKEVIGLVVLIFALTLSFFFITSQLIQLAGRLGELIDHADELIQVAKATSGSGVTAA